MEILIIFAATNFLEKMSNQIVRTNFRLHQRITLVIMLVLLQFYSIGSDFFFDDLASDLIERVEPASHEILDFDDHASLRTVRQEEVRVLEMDLLVDLFTLVDLHELIHTLELRQCVTLPSFYNLHDARTFIWFCTYLI